MEKILQGEDLRSTISFRDRPGADEDDPRYESVPRPPRTRARARNLARCASRPPASRREGEEFSIGSLIPIGTQVEDRDDVVSAFSEGLRYGGVEMRIKQEPHQVRTGRDTATS